MKKNKVTLKQLGEALGISVSSVSKALNDSTEISYETKLKVLEMAKKMGYKGTGASIAVNKTIAVIIPDIANDFFTQVLSGLEQEARDHNFKIIAGFTNESYKQEVSYLKSLHKESIDGFIVAAARETQELDKFDHFEHIINQGIPLVMFDRVIEELECDKIVTDDFLSGTRMVETLVESGDQHICMASTISMLSVGKLREKGIRNKISKYNNVLLNVITSTKEVDFINRIEDALKYDGIQSIIALDQKAGALALNKAHELGIKVPEELQLVCYSNGLLSNYSYPPMSVLDQHANEIGKKAFIRMFNLINNTDPVKVTRIHTLKSTLIKRGTTRN